MSLSDEQLFKKQGYVMTYKCLIKELGTVEAVFLSELLSKHKYFESRNMLDAEGYFYCTYNDIYESTGIKRRQLESLRSKLQEFGFIEYKRKGIPAKIWYKINYEKVLETAK
jgi:hypothetical protein